LKGVALDNYQKASIDKSSHICEGQQINTYSSQAHDLGNSTASVTIPDLSVPLCTMMVQPAHVDG